MGFVFAIILIAVGGYLSFWANRRAFNRRNMAGVEEFKSYSDSIAKRGIEKLARIGGRILLVVGVLFLIGAFISHHTTPPTAVPAAATHTETTPAQSR